jgi:phosphate:Na+ symporter
MEYGFYDFLNLIGSLGLFLYGMKLMSEALQKAAGNKLRNILATMTSNRFTGILTGIMITALIQSSSATTVMVVSFVNAGLVSLSQSVSVIMGANIGTTVTAWIISLFGFKVDIAAFSIPLIAFSIPLIFSKNNKKKDWGEFILGFAILFLGLQYLKDSLPDIKNNPQILSFLSDYTNMGFGSTLIFVLVGTLLTILVQSSSATMAITLIMLAEGWIKFDIAAAMVLGENIGTTVTANLAALSGNISAKRTALSHTIFNISGVIWMLIVFAPFTSMVHTLVGQVVPLNSPEHNAFALSLFHSLFNIINVLVLVWFAKVIVSTVTRIIPQKHTDEEFHLSHISTGLLSTSELSILQAKQEILVYAERTQRMFGLVRQLYHEKNESEFVKLYSRIQKYENISDRMEVEIASYLTKVGEGRLSDESKQAIHMMLRLVTEIESVADSCYNLSRTLERKRSGNVSYPDDIDANVELMFNLLDGALDEMLIILSKATASNVDISKSLNMENEINNFRNQLKMQNVDDVKNHKYQYPASVIYMDLVVECEKMGDYIVNVAEAVAESKIKPFV